PPLAFAVTSPQSLAWAGTNGYAILNSGLFTPTPAVLQGRQIYVDSLVAAGHSQATVHELLARWVVSKHVYVAPTDAEAQADTEGPERWYLEAFIRSIRADDLKGLDESIYRESSGMVAKMSELTWEGLLDTCLIVGSPETVRRKMADLERSGVGE